MKSDPVIAVVGAGAVGSYYGGRLAQHGQEVHFLLRRDYEKVRREGLVVKSCRGDFRLAPGAVRAHTDPRQMPKADLVIVALKTTANGEFSQLIGPLVHEGTTILTLQNGLGNEEQLAAIFGGEKVVGGIAFVCINRTPEGVIDHSAEGLVRIGEFAPGAGMGRVTAIAEMMNRSGIECEVMTDLRQMRWEKLLWNVPFNGLSTVMDLTTDRILATEAGEKLVREIMAEVIAAARGNGAVINEALVDRHITRTRAMGAYFTSSHLDRRFGRAIEAESLFGNPVRAARKAGVPVPHMEKLYQMILMLGSSQVNRR